MLYMLGTITDTS